MKVCGGRGWRCVLGEGVLEQGKYVCCVCSKLHRHVYKLSLE